jgi:YD repeat-containing protein
VSAAIYAYPTTVADPGGYSSTIQYRYDIGANVHAESPTPYGASDGKNTSRVYDDAIGRLVRETVDNTGAYTRYDYPNNDGVTVKTYTTVVDITGVGTVDSSDEVLTETLLDGAGRVRMTRTENPNSAGGYTAKLVEYDLLGRVKRETVPTESDLSWAPDGDDDRGSGVWLWNSREYDWKNRVTREINTDSTDKLYSYDGCGCAGGQVTTVKGEVTEAADVAGNMQTTKRRTRKIYEDILGRSYKSELWDLDGGGSAPYSTTVNAYNGRDQVLRVRQYSGSDTSTTYQDTTFEFDGHGRLKKSHKPEQFDSSNVATYTVFTYNADDTVATTTDPRGAVTTYKYGHIDEGTVDSFNEYRNVLTKIEYTSPNTTGIPDPPDVRYSYDPAGNRKKMTDGSGTLDYSYDQLSRLVEETKAFDSGVLSTPRTGGYSLQYTYHLTGGIKSITDPHTGQGWHVEYASDKVGRATAIGSATGFGSQTSFASGISYRAFGGVKSMTYSTTSATNVSVTYDNRLRPASYEAESSANTVDIQNKTYTYTSDGSLKQATNAVNGDYSQDYEYDFAGRLKKNHVGGLGTQFPGTRYKQTLGYDAFDNLTSRSTVDDGTSRSFTAGYTNNRKTSGGYQNGTDSHDAAGNVTYNTAGYLDNRTWKFDAAGRVSDWEETSTYLGTTRWDQGEAVTFDGDGRAAKREKRSRIYAFPATGWSYVPEYAIYSSVTGQKVLELAAGGARDKVNIYMGSTVVAEHTTGGTAFKHTDSVTGSTMQTNPAGEMEAYDVGRVELNALGDVLATQPPETQEPPHNFGKGGGTHDPYGGCAVNGQSRSCSEVLRMLGSRIATVDLATSDPWAMGELNIPVVRYVDVSPPEDPNSTVTRTVEMRVWEYYGSGSGFLNDNQAQCDSRIAGIFGGGGSIVATATEPASVTGTGKPRNRIGMYGEDPADGVMHQFSNSSGTPVSGDGFVGNLYVPIGYASVVGKADDYYVEDENERKVLDTVYSNIQVSYRAGALARYGYTGALTISFVHAGPVNNVNRVPSLIRNGEIRSNGTQLIGTIGADGSPYDGGGGGGRSKIQYFGSKRRADTKESPYTPSGYVHNHVIFYSRFTAKSRIRIDPRTVFCRDLGF